MIEGICPYCSTPARQGALRCRSCRAWFERRCAMCGRLIKGEEARVGQCGHHAPTSDREEAGAPWRVHYQVDGRGAGILIVYAPPYQSGAPGLTRGRAFENLTDLPRWLERAIRDDMALTGLRSGVLEVDANVDWHGRDTGEEHGGGGPSSESSGAG